MLASAMLVRGLPMKRVYGFGVPMLALVAVAGVAAGRVPAGPPPAVSVVAPAQVALTAAPIRPEWLIEGHPDTRAAEIAHSADGLTQVYVWQTSKTRFHWIYDFDETITIVDGEVFIAEDGGPERHLGPGDSAFFPTGAHTTWRVPDHLRKVATVKKPLPGPLASLLRYDAPSKAG